MPVPSPILYPPFIVTRLSHVDLGMTNLAASRMFYANTLGLQVTHEDATTIYLRGLEERGHHCVILRQGPGEVGVLGFKVYSEADLDAAHAFFTAMGQPAAWVTKPFMGRTLRTQDPFGTPLEFYATMDRLPPIHPKYALYSGVNLLRIDHFNGFSPDVDASVAFYNSFGFRVTEYTEGEASHRLWAASMHRKSGAHDMAFTNGCGPRLHHLAFWVPSPINIIDLLDLIATTGYVANIERGPGHHGISNTFFLYFSIPTATRPKFTAPITKPSIPTTSRSDGTSRTRSAKPSGVLRRQKAGSKTAPPLPGF